MYKLLCPSLVAKSVYDINGDKLGILNIKGIIFDLDNTIIPWDRKQMSQDIVKLLNNFQEQGYKLCLVSNNREQRVKEIAAQFDIPYFCRAYKPAKRGFKKASLALGLPPEQIAVIGDQLFTDILGGNRLGMVTIWVQPLSAKEFIGTKVTRQLERIAVALLKRKGLIK